LLAEGGFLVLNLYSMGLSATLAKSAVNQLIPSPSFEQFGELLFTDRAGKSLPLGVYYRCVK
jgi:23S rRNA (cytosine1962-C5)-methyltransferase